MPVHALEMVVFMPLQAVDAPALILDHAVLNAEVMELRELLKNEVIVGHALVIP